MMAVVYVLAGLGFIVVLLVAWGSYATYKHFA